MYMYYAIILQLTRLQGTTCMAPLMVPLTNTTRNHEACCLESGLVFFMDDGPNIFDFDFMDPWNVVNNLEGNSW